MHDSIYGMRKARVVDMALLPGAFREKLVRAGMEIGRVAPADVVSSPDGTKKILLELRCGSVIEAVGIPGDVPGDAASGDGPRRRRFTACVSSQVGCAMRCSFCATGRQGYKRNLDAAEMVNQVMALEDVFQRRATNVVMMGMGEPLMNLGNVLEAHRCLNADVGIGGRYFTISTVGVPNAIAKLAAHKLQATLAVSLHAPNQALRERLIPSAKAYPLDALLRDCRAYKKVTGRRVTFEYTLLAGENDSVEHAEALAALLRRNVGGGCHVNLLPWNPVRGAEETHARPSAKATRRFAEALERERGITLTVRKTRGLEADAACGQLTGSFVRKRRVSGGV
jgi:23S rRNA (adenine2503-C2)-methyltransferase